jgi:hypothetical protein
MEIQVTLIIDFPEGFQPGATLSLVESRMNAIREQFRGWGAEDVEWLAKVVR